MSFRGWKALLVRRKARNQEGATGKMLPLRFKIIFNCYVQQQVTIVLPSLDNISWLRPCTKV